MIETDAHDAVWQYKIEPDYSTYMGLVFEKACKEFLLRLNTKIKLPFIFTNIGRWWGSDPQNKKQAEIDIIANDNKNYIFCECKWRNVPIDVNVLRTLQNRADLVIKHEKNGKVYFAVFSKSGFNEEMKKQAVKEGNVLLFNADDLFYPF